MAGWLLGGSAGRPSDRPSASSTYIYIYIYILYYNNAYIYIHINNTKDSNPTHKKYNNDNDNHNNNNNTNTHNTTTTTTTTTTNIRPPPRSRPFRPFRPGERAGRLVFFFPRTGRIYININNLKTSYLHTIEFPLKARRKSNLSKQLVFKLFMFMWMFPALGQAFSEDR